MPKIQRKTQKVFCNSADSDQLAVFGSMSTGTPVYSSDVEELQSNEAFDLGWDAATLEDKAPFMEEMNGVQYGLTYQIAYGLQEGIPEYDSATTYYIGSICKVLEDGKPILYTSLTDDNIGNNPVNDSTNWERLSFGGGGLEIGDVGFTQMAIDESKGKRRILNGQLIIQDQYVQFTNIIKNSVALNPDLACTESEWQTELTMSANGVCYKFVIDDEAGTIRLPKYPEYLDLSINGAKTVSVYGTGKTLGLTNGTKNFTLGDNGVSSNPWPIFITTGFGSNYGTAFTGSGSGTTGIVYDHKTVGVTTNSTKSGLTGSVTTSSEQIKGTYFIQVATGAETEDNIINEIELNNPFSLLDYKYSEYELNNLSWLRSNGQYNSKAIYPAVYDLLLKIYNGVETKAGVSVKLTTETFTEYDFVLNTAEETFRLPIKVKQNFYNNIAPVVGNGMTLGLTDGTNNSAMFYNTASTQRVEVSNDLYGANVGTNATYSGRLSNSLGIGVTTNPSKSGIEAKLTNANLYLYFYVGETVQNANLVNIGRIQETYTTKSMVDGRWIPARQNVLQNVGMAARTERIIDLSDYLPNDGYAYEVIIAAWVKSGATSGYAAELNVYNEFLPELRWVTAVTRTSNDNQASGVMTLPVGLERNFTLKSVTDEPMNIISLGIRSYRRIGTNL